MCSLEGKIWLQTVEFGSVLECDWKMRFIVPKNHPERKRTSILVEWGRKKLKLIDFLSQSWSAQTNVVGCAHPFGSVASDAQNPRHVVCALQLCDKKSINFNFFRP